LLPLFINEDSANAREDRLHYLLRREGKVELKGKKLSIAMIGCGGISEIQLDVLRNSPR